MTVVFVHIPKTAGTALSEAIHTRVGMRLRFEGYSHTTQTPYWHQRMLYRMYQRIYRLTRNSPHIEHLCQTFWHALYIQPPDGYIFGHFYVQTYLQPAPNNLWQPIPNYRYITFVRDPLQRAISKYYYTLTPSQSGLSTTETHRFAQQFPTLVDFLKSPQYANIQHNYLKALPIDAYTLIGIVEDIEKSLVVLGHAVNELANLSLAMVNKATSKNTAEIHAIQPDVIHEFRQRNARDYELYDAARTKLNNQYQSIMYQSEESA